MTMQGGAVKYTPSVNNGNWTVLCQIPQQAKAIAFGADQTPAGSSTVTPDSAYILNVWTGAEPVPGLADLYASKPTSYDSAVLNTPYFMAGTRYFDNATSWYIGGLPKNTAGASTGGMAPSSYTGSGKDFLDSYFRTGIQTAPGIQALSGSTSGEANSQILMKTSAYWVAVTHVMYNLDMAEKNIAANNTAGAKANFDSAAAAYFGCGDTNPVPLPLYRGTKITYSKTASTPDTGLNATTMSVYGVANKRADNYGTAGLVSTNGGTCTSSSATCKTVAAINVEVGKALTAGPSAANIATVRDATLTIFTQAAQRYVAKLTLAAQLPGNGMGGSTYVDQVTATTALTSGSYVPSTIGSNGLKSMQTSCGQKASYISVTGATVPAAGAAGTGGGVGSYKVTGVNSCGASGSVTLKGSPVSNTATFGSVQAEVIGYADNYAANAGVPPYQVPTVVYADDDAAKDGGSISATIIKATRGLPPTAALPAASAAPVACIGATVAFNEVINNGNAGNGQTPNAQKAITLCNPRGRQPPATVTAVTTKAARIAAYGAATGAIVANIDFWDPITASLVTNGAFCCASLIYSAEGLGRVPNGEVPAPSSFIPPMIGGDMSAQTSASPGGMCPISGDQIKSIQDATSPTEVNLLEGQAFYAVMAPMQYTIQTTSTNSATQGLRAGKQKVCAETITKMMKLSPASVVPAGTATGPQVAGTATAACVNPNRGAAPTTDAEIANSAITCRGNDASAIDYPMWQVAIGGNTAGSGSLNYYVPNGYCYANACFEDFAEFGLTAAYKGKTKLSALVKSPDMSSNPTTVGTAPAAKGACGRANNACAAAPSGWTGGQAEFVLCPVTNVLGGSTTCTSTQIQAQMGRIPVA
jgi:hypothetical protein